MTTPMGISIPSRSAVLELIDQICDRYEAAWLAGQRPRIEDKLATTPEVDRPGLLRELLGLELELRRAGGERRAGRARRAGRPPRASSSLAWCSLAWCSLASWFRRQGPQKKKGT